jgi:hypothetical protein
MDSIERWAATKTGIGINSEKRVRKECQVHFLACKASSIGTQDRQFENNESKQHGEDDNVFQTDHGHPVYGDRIRMLFDDDD